MKAHEFLLKLEHLLHKQGWAKHQANFTTHGHIGLYYAMLLLDTQLHPAGLYPTAAKEIAHKALKQHLGVDDLCEWELNPLRNRDDIFRVLKDVIHALKEAGL